MSAEASMVRFGLLGVVGSILAALVAAFAGACEKKAANTPSRAAAPTAPAAPAGPPMTFADDAALIKALRAGGYVIAVRHAHTNPDHSDAEHVNLEDCATQRTLDDQGRAEARAIGEAVKAIRIPVAQVLSSPYCRTKETAELAFGKYTVNKACVGADEAAKATRAEIMGAQPAAGANTVIVTHSDAMGASVKERDFLADFKEGAGLVIVPKGGGEFQAVYTIKFADWARLAEAAKTMP